MGLSDRIKQLKDGLKEIIEEKSDYMKEFLRDAKCPANVDQSVLLPGDNDEEIASFIPQNPSDFQR